MSAGSYQSAMATMRTYFKAQWASVGGGIPVEMPNSPMALDGTPFVKPKSSPWARFTTLADAAPITLSVGATPERAFGTLQLEIFVPLNAGEAAGLQIADTFASLWRNYPLPDFLFQPTRVTEWRRSVDDPAWGKNDALTQFEREYVP